MQIAVSKSNDIGENNMFDLNDGSDDYSQMTNYSIHPNGQCI